MAYQRYLVVLDRLDTHSTGYAASAEKFEAMVHELNEAGSIIELIAPSAVREAQHGVSAVYQRISARMGELMPSGESVVRAHEIAFQERRDEVLAAVEALKEAMRPDLNRGLLEDGDEPEATPRG